MKPTWKDAPDWAQYLAMDYDGHWHWYENEPTPDGGDDDEWFVKNGGKYLLAHDHLPGWTTTLEPRPTTAEELEDDHSA